MMALDERREGMNGFSGGGHPMSRDVRDVRDLSAFPTAVAPAEPRLFSLE